MNPLAEALKQRTHDFFVAVIAFCRTVPESTDGDSITAQLIDSAGSTDSNYRACCKARSKKDFISKVGIAAEEADESLGWLEALQAAGLGDAKGVVPLIKEADELTRIFVKSGQTASKNLAAEQARRKRRNGIRRRARGG